VRAWGIEFEKEEVLEFKQFAPFSKGAVLLRKMLDEVERRAFEDVANGELSEVRIRNAQGRIRACAEVNELARRFVEMDLEKWEGKEDEEMGDEIEMMEASDVGF